MRLVTYEYEGRVAPGALVRDRVVDLCRALRAARSAAPDAIFLVWYPIKALTRPRALLSMLTEGGLHGTAVELISTPLRLKRDKLAGSGVFLLGVPERAVRELLSSLARLGPALMTHGEWSAQQIGF